MNAITAPGAPARVPATPVLITPAAPGRAAAALPAGAILDAVVVARSGRDLTLDVGGARIQTRSDLALPSGRPFAVEVRSAGPRLVLEVLDASVRHQAARAEALRCALPRQLALGRALDQVAGDRARPDARAPAGPAERQVASVLRAIPDAAALARPAALARAIQDSGLLLEAKLARAVEGHAPARVETDLKALLLRALGRLDRSPGPRAGAGNRAQQAQPSPAHGPPFPATPGPASAAPGAGQSAGQGVDQGNGHGADHSRGEVSRSRSDPRTPAGLAPAGGAASATTERALDGALARVQTLQLASSDPARTEGLHWHVEIPVRDGDQVSTLALVVTRDGASGEEAADARWSVDVAVDLGERGTLQGRVTLTAGVVNAALWASDQATCELVAQHIDGLHADLEAAGLEVGRVLVRPVPAEPPRDRASLGTLVRERA